MFFYIRLLVYSVIILVIYVMIYNKNSILFPESVLIFFIIISIAQYFINKINIKVSNNSYFSYFKNISILHSLIFSLLISLYKILVSYNVVDLVLNFDINDNNLIIGCLRFVILLIYLIITTFYYNDYKKNIQSNVIKDIMFYLFIILSINIFYVKNLIFFYIYVECIYFLLFILIISILTSNMDNKIKHIENVKVIIYYYILNILVGLLFLMWISFTITCVGDINFEVLENIRDIIVYKSDNNLFYFFGFTLFFICKLSLFPFYSIVIQFLKIVPKFFAIIYLTVIKIIIFYFFMKMIHIFFIIEDFISIIFVSLCVINLIIFLSKVWREYNTYNLFLHSSIFNITNIIITTLDISIDNNIYICLIFFYYFLGTISMIITFTIVNNINTNFLYFIKINNIYIHNANKLLIYNFFSLLLIMGLAPSLMFMIKLGFYDFNIGNILETLSIYSTLSLLFIILSTIAYLPLGIKYMIEYSTINKIFIGNKLTLNYIILVLTIFLLLISPLFLIL